jgi:hypothetical protein
MIRSVEDWVKILEPLDSVDSTAKRILDDLAGYPVRSMWEHDDIRQLANALRAIRLGK